MKSRKDSINALVTARRTVEMKLSSATRPGDIKKLAEALATIIVTLDDMEVREVTFDVPRK